ncbi:hypothetical protein [Mesorhizobium sp. 1B3]|uniref:hypothetical protein n=1 Tax=Mesorhizobium sp. 1B3 TaxID=3243599 RepID=UPI003D9983BB
MQLHQRGVDLLVNVLDSIDRVDQLTAADTRALLQEVAEVMSLILERDARLALKMERRYSAEQLARETMQVQANPKKSPRRR